MPPPVFDLFWPVLSKTQKKIMLWLQPEVRCPHRWDKNVENSPLTNVRQCGKVASIMIDVAQLRKSDIGRWVEYRGTGGEIERGKLKSWNESFIFVVYKCEGDWDRFQDFTGAATEPEDLVFIEMKME